MAHAGSDDYLRISARSCLREMGAGGTTAKPRKPPFDLRIGGGFVIFVDEDVD